MEKVERRTAWCTEVNEAPCCWNLFLPQGKTPAVWSCQQLSRQWEKALVCSTAKSFPTASPC